MQLTRSAMANEWRALAADLSVGPGTDDYRERKVRSDSLGRVLEKHEACYID